MALFACKIGGSEGSALQAIPQQTYTNPSYNQSSDSHTFVLPDDVKCFRGTLRFANTVSTFTAYILEGTVYTSSQLGATVNRFDFVLSGTNLTVSINTQVLGVTTYTVEIDGAH